MGEHNCYMKNAAECIKKKAYELREKERRKQCGEMLFAYNTVLHKERVVYEG